ncbi:MAG: AAA family ATPase, partial [Phocaeicola sp.]
LSYIFQGRRDLFAGLKIDSMDYDWMEYPVVNLNMSKMNYSSPEDFTNELKDSLFDIADSLSITVSKEAKPGLIFNDILTKAAAQSPTGKVVLLIDEYDAPLVNNIDAPHLEEIRAILENFYIQIKAANSVLRFTFMTGVTRFSKVSVFSKLNHMVDISMDKAYATMLGFTQTELETHFGERVAQLAQEEDMEYDSMLSKIKLWYNGYRFHHKGETVYNPVSVGRFMNQGEFKNWWFETGSPSFLIQQLRKKPISYFDLLHEPVSEDFVGSFDPAKIDARSLLFQTGYLTIDTAESEGSWGLFYTLKFPNIEVEVSMTRYLMAELGSSNIDKPFETIRPLVKALRNGDSEALYEILYSHFASIPYDAPVLNEGNFKALIYFLFRMAGMNTGMEQVTNWGRADLVVELSNRIYIFELKYNRSADEAMDQINQRRYFEKYQSQGKEIHLLALNFSTEERNISKNWRVVRLN